MGDCYITFCLTYFRRSFGWVSSFKPATLCRAEDGRPSCTGLRVGDRVVALAPHATEAVVAKERYVKIPDEVGDEAATFAILGATTTHGMRRAGVRYGETVLVLGLGVVGLLSVMHARRSGAATVIVADPLAGKRSLAGRLGFDHVLDPGADGYLHELESITQGHRADLVIEASGAASALETCFVSIAHHGRLLVQGTHLVPVPIDFSDYTMHQETTIISTWAIGSATTPGHRLPTLAPMRQTG